MSQAKRSEHLYLIIASLVSPCLGRYSPLVVQRVQKWSRGRQASMLKYRRPPGVFMVSEVDLML